MISYPVHYRVAQPGRFTRLQLALRILAFVALGVVGVSFGTVFAFAFIALPVFAASRLSVTTPASYLDEDGRRVVKALRWFAAVSAWTGLVAETLPGKVPEDTVMVDIDPGARPTASSAVWRVLTGIPSALVLAILGCIGCVVWLWAALSILFRQRIGPGAFAYLVGLQRWSIRLLALAVVGGARARFVARPPWRCAVEMVVLAGGAALISFAIGAVLAGIR